MENQNENTVTETEATAVEATPVVQKRRGRPLSDTGFMGQCRAIVAANPGLSRQDFLKLAANVKVGEDSLPAATASVYWHQIKKASAKASA